MGNTHLKIDIIVKKYRKTKNGNKNMSSYTKVLNEVNKLTITEKLRLLEELKNCLNQSGEFEETEEIISSEEIAESEIAWQDYLSGKDQGVSSRELKKWLKAKVI